MARRRRRTRWYSRRRSGSSSLLGLLTVALLLILGYGLATNYPWILASLLLFVLVIVGASMWLLLLRRYHQFTYAQTVENMLSMLTPIQFEEKTGEVLRGIGYRHVQHTGRSGDLGADLMCVTPQGKRTIVQCKQYALNHPVGSPEIHQFMGAMQTHGAQVGLFVTTAFFSQPARMVARRAGIILIDGQELARLSQQAERQQQARYLRWRRGPGELWGYIRSMGASLLARGRT
jgi:HJR/Mrr/RecB family endonuclease